MNRTNLTIPGITIMKIKLLRILLIAAVLFVSAAPVCRLFADDKAKKEPDIYNESLDGPKQIDEAVALAQKEHKRVLLQFGANWCIWCHRLHNLCESDKNIAETLKANYVVALVDVNNGHNGELIKKYDAERDGLPFIVILDGDGKHLKTKNTSELEEGDHHSPAKVMAFLNEWKPKK